MKGLTRKKTKLLQVILTTFLISILTACQTASTNLELPTLHRPALPKIQMIEKDGEHILTTHDATLLLIYIKELEAYADKLSLQNKILKGDKDEMSIH